MRSEQHSTRKTSDYNEPVDPYRCYLYGPTHDGRELGEIGLSSFYSPEEVEAVNEDLERLFLHFKSGYLVAQAHSTPSPSWRDETAASLAHSALSRFGVRLHVYEKAFGEQLIASTNRAAGRYLGFVTLRPPSRDGKPLERIGFGYVLEAELLPPRHTQRPRYHIVRTTASSSRMGVLPFLSTVFMTPDEDNSTCVHLAISQALHLIMGRFGAIPISQREFEIELWKRHPEKSLEALSKAGATLPEALEIVRERCRTGGFVVDIDISPESGCQTREDVWKESLRVITDSLAAGLPVIVMVNHRKLVPAIDRRGEELGGELEGVPHGALVFGMRLLNSGSELGEHHRIHHHGPREDESELPGIFVGHDSYHGPYTEWTTEQLFRAALQCPVDGGERQGIRFLVLGPRDMELGLDRARALARQFVIVEYEGNPKIFKDYRRRFGRKKRVKELNPKLPQDWRYVTRLMTTDEIDRVYTPNASRKWGGGSSGEAHRVFASGVKRQGYWWVVELLLPVYGVSTGAGIRNKALLIYIFDVSLPWTEKGSEKESAIQPIILELDLSKEGAVHRMRRGSPP